MKINDPIHRDDDGKWYFWTETWADREGPFESREAADKALLEYCRTILSENPGC